MKDPIWDKYAFEYYINDPDIGSFYGDTAQQCRNAYNEALRVAAKHQRLNPQEAGLYEDIRDLRQGMTQV